MFTLIPLAIAGCIGVYLYFEWDALMNVIKYVCYGVGGVFTFIALCNILGVIFGRSEKFMSNDNNKYAFGGNSIRSARANVNQSVRDAQIKPGTQNVQHRPVQSNAQPLSASQNMQARPIQPARPMQSTRPQINSNAQSTARPVGTMNAGVPQRTMQRNSQVPPRPTNPTQQVRRPVSPNQAQQRPQPNARPISNAPKKYCIRCGKLLNPDEKICTICGTKIMQ